MLRKHTTFHECSKKGKLMKHLRFHLKKQGGKKKKVKPKESRRNNKGMSRNQ